MIKFLRIFLLTVGFVAACPARPIDEMIPRIVPGNSIGSVELGNNGAEALRRLPKPYASDAGMSQTRQVWRLGNAGGRFDTLFIHTVSNGAIGAQPADGVTIDLIRVTAERYRTAQGISVGSTVKSIRKEFPDVAPVAGVPTVLDAVHRGIAFEFERNPGSQSRCIAIMVHSPGEARVATRKQVAGLLENAEQP
jgi:hypothetical protein